MRPSRIFSFKLSTSAVWLSSDGGLNLKQQIESCGSQYEEQVRALMPPGFSGLMLADHTLLINLLKNLRETVFSEPPEPLTRSVDLFLEAMEECYDAHNVICEAFVNQGPSLRDIDNSRNQTKPATEMLDKLKNKRKRMLSSKSTV